MSDADEMLSRIKQYLSVGGLFNPEMMDHDKVRDMIVDCRAALTAQQQEIERLREALHEIKLLPHHNDVNGNELICRAADIADSALTGKEGGDG